MPTKHEVISQTKSWIERIVIGHNFCPFAAHPFRSDKIRYWVLVGKSMEEHLEILVREWEHLARHPEIATSLLIFPDALSEFEVYLDFLGLAEELVYEQGYEGMFQLASFHPTYQFADSDFSDSANFTNRSPYPMLHILREESVSWAIDAHENTEQIPEQNIQRAQELGSSYFEQILTEIREN